MTDSVAAIAARLTEAQRQLVLSHGSTPRRLAEGVGKGKHHSAKRAADGVSGVFVKTWGSDCHRYHLSSLGLALRAHLASASHSEQTQEKAHG